MNTRTRIRIATCTIICCLLLAMVASVATAVPYRIYEEQKAGTNFYYVGAVVGDTCYTGQMSVGAEQWGDEQVGSPATALLNQSATPFGSNWAKCSLPLGGYIYSTNGAFDLRRQATWAEASVPVLPASQWAPDAICTDGTYIYATQGSSAFGVSGKDTNLIWKFAVNHETNTLTLLATWVKGTASDHRFRALSYYNGKLYAVNHKKAGGQLYEVDPDTGVFTQLAATPTAVDSHYQAVRYGNQIFVVGLDCNLYTYTYNAGDPPTATLTSTFPTGYTYASPYGLFGIGVKGDGTTAKYAWITGPPGGPPAGSPRMSFWDLSPWTTPTNLGDPKTWKNGYPVYVSDAVVTVIGTDGFWVENKGRTVGAHVLWAAGAMPAVNTVVSIKGTGGKTASGEKFLTAIEVTAGAEYTVKPLFVTNKSMAVATGGVGRPTDGLLVTICGKVTNFNWTTSGISVDDGSRVPGEAAGVIGVKTLKADGTTLMDVTNIDMAYSGTPCYAKVTGIARLEQLTDGTGTIIRRIDARSTADIVITAL